MACHPECFGQVKGGIRRSSALFHDDEGLLDTTSIHPGHGVAEGLAVLRDRNEGWTVSADDDCPWTLDFCQPEFGGQNAQRPNPFQGIYLVTDWVRIRKQSEWRISTGQHRTALVEKGGLHHRCPNVHGQYHQAPSCSSKTL